MAGLLPPPPTSRGLAVGFMFGFFISKFFPQERKGRRRQPVIGLGKVMLVRGEGGGGLGEKQPLAQVCSTERGKGLSSFPRALPGQGDSSRGWSVWVQPGGSGSAWGGGQSGPGRGYSLVQMVDSRKSRRGEQRQACTEVWDRMCLPHLLPAPAT